MKTLMTKLMIDSFNAYQESGLYHPYTCGNPDCRAVLIATEKGIVCPNCGYKQTFVNRWTLNWEWKYAQ